jgi:hypothetical protein
LPKLPLPITLSGSKSLTFELALLTSAGPEPGSFGFGRQRDEDSGVFPLGSVSGEYRDNS